MAPRFARLLLATTLAASAALLSTHALAGDVPTQTPHALRHLAPTVCTPDDEEFEFASDLQADKAGNRFVLFNRGVISLTASGRERWRFMPCALEGASPSPPWWGAIAPDQHGGVWVARRQPDALYISKWAALARIDARGQTASVGVLEDTHLRRLTLLTSRNGAQALFSQHGRPEVRVHDFDLAGTPSPVRAVPMPAPDLSLFRAILFDDGDLIALFFSLNFNEFDTTPNRIVYMSFPAGAQTAIWTTANTVGAMVDLDSNGTAWMLDASSTLESISPDGTRSARDVLPHIVEDVPQWSFAGPIDGHFAVFNETSMRRVSVDGTRGDSDPFVGHEMEDLSEPSPFGFLVPARFHDDGAGAALYKSDRLGLVAQFLWGLDAPWPDMYEFAKWSILSDGSIVSAITRTDADGVMRVWGAGFTVPGSPADARVLRDGFEP